jgi:hypothetical protein
MFIVIVRVRKDIQRKSTGKNLDVMDAKHSHFITSKWFTAIIICWVMLSSGTNFFSFLF